MLVLPFVLEKQSTPRGPGENETGRAKGWRV